MTLTEKNIREKEFHNIAAVKKKPRFEGIFYKAVFNARKHFFDYLNINARGKEILDFGCGIGGMSRKVYELGPKRIVGIDISDEAIKLAISKAEELNLKIEYKIENCEKLNLPLESFDIVYGFGILHHLNLLESINEITKVLKKKGSIIFVEPLGTNPIINLYRVLTPKSRSQDEHPFMFKDLDLIKNHFKFTKINYYGFLTIIFFLFYKNPEKSIIYNFLSQVDNFIFKIKYLRFLAWSVMITAEKN